MRKAHFYRTMRSYKLAAFSGPGVLRRWKVSLMLSKFVDYITHFCCLGKQVKILYEPVAVRQIKIVRLPDATPGTPLGISLRRLSDKNAKSKHPGRSIRPI